MKTYRVLVSLFLLYASASLFACHEKGVSQHEKILALIAKLPEKKDHESKEYEEQYATIAQEIQTILAMGKGYEKFAVLDCALSKAILRDNPTAAKLLLEQGAPANGWNGSRPLMLAIRADRKKIVSLLLDHGALVSTGLSAAADHGHAEIVSLLLTHQKKIKASRTRSPELEKYFDEEDEFNKKSALLSAIRQNNQAIVKMLIEEGVDVTALGEEILFNHNNAALNIALEPARQKALQELNAPSASDGFKKIVLSYMDPYAPSKNRDLYLRAILPQVAADSTPVDRNKTTLTIMALNAPHEVFKMFFTLAKPNVNKLDSNGLNTLMVYAKKRKHHAGIEKNIKLLIQHNIELGATHRGDTPLHMIAANQADPASKINLLSQHPNFKAFVNKTNLHGKTALHVAVEMGHLQTVNELIKLRADTTIKDIFGKSPDDYLAQAAFQHKKISKNAFIENSIKLITIGELQRTLKQELDPENNQLPPAHDAVMTALEYIGTIDEL